VFIFELIKSSGDMYVGSSTNLSRRINGYIKKYHKEVGKFLPILYKEGVTEFNLKIFILNENYTINDELILEQYYLLHKEYNLNTLRVVNSVLGARSKSLYMYTKDYKKLIYYSDNQEDFIFNFNIHYTTIKDSIKTGKLYLNKYIFTDIPILNTYNFNNENISIEEIKTMLDKDRTDYKSSIKLSRKIILKKINNNEIQIFSSLKDSLQFLNKIGSSSKTTLLRKIKNGKPYHGFTCG